MQENVVKKENLLKKHFLTWLIAILPITLFVVILGWVITIVFRWIWRIVDLFPQVMVERLLLPESVINFLWFLILCGIIRFLWFIANQWHIWERFKKVWDPMVAKIPLLNSLSKITNQVADTLQNSSSFKRVVLVRFPNDKIWSIGFVTGENPEVFEWALNWEDLISIFIPTTPNPTNWFLALMNPKDFIDTDVPVSLAISFIISMGTAWATQEILKKTGRA